MNKKIFSVIYDAYPALKLLPDDYFIIGSAALVLTGIDIKNIPDIDILTSDRNANYLKEIWKDKLVENHITKRDDLFSSNFAHYNFEALDIEVMGNLKIQNNNKWEPLIIQDYVIISDGEMQIKVPTLQEQERILKLFGREKDLVKLNLIATFRNKKAT